MPNLILYIVHLSGTMYNKALASMRTDALDPFIASCSLHFPRRPSSAPRFDAASVSGPTACCVLVTMQRQCPVRPRVVCSVSVRSDRVLCAGVPPADIGTVMKVVSVPRGSWHDLEEVLLEEMTVFRVGRPLDPAPVSPPSLRTGVAVRWVVITPSSSFVVLCLQEPTAITAMELSTKQVMMPSNMR